jgi:hypothetical protein
MKPLVCDEIQHHEINIGRVWDRAGASVMLGTCLMNLRLGSSSHMILPVGVPSNEPE